MKPYCYLGDGVSEREALNDALEYLAQSGYDVSSIEPEVAKASDENEVACFIFQS